MQRTEPKRRDPVITLAKTILLLLVLYGGYRFLSEISSLVKVLLAGALIAYLLDPLVVFLESHGLRRIYSTIVVFVALAATIAVSFNLLLPAVSGELAAIKEGLGGERAARTLERLDGVINEKFAFLGAGEVNLIDMWTKFVVESVNDIIGYLFDAVTVATSLLLVPFIAFFLLADGRGFKKRAVRLVPNYYFEFTLNLVHKMDRLLGRYLRGVSLDALIIGILSTSVLWAQDVKYFVVLGCVIGLTNIIPYFGPVVGAVPAVVVALLQTGDIRFAALVALALMFVQVIDNIVVKPLVLSRMVDLHPLSVLLAVIIGGRFFGVYGLFLSVPAVAVFKVVATETLWKFRQYYMDRHTHVIREQDVYLGSGL